MNATTPSAINNEMIYEFLTEFKAEMREFKVEMREFKTEMREFKTDTNRRFDEIFDLIRDEKQERKKNEDKLEKIYESRNLVCINFTRSWMFSSFFMAIFSAIIALAINQAFFV
jgi:hypothetical protein